MELKSINLPLRNVLLRYRKAPETSLEDTVRRYGAQPQLFHTIFYGEPGCGKYRLALLLLSSHLGIPVSSLLKQTLVEVTHPKQKSIYLSRSLWHFEIFVDGIPMGSRPLLLELLQELARTYNVSSTRYNIVILRGAEHLGRNIQQKIRRLLETMTPMCRLILTTRNLPSLELSIQSRCFRFRVPSLAPSLPRPEVDLLDHFVGEAMSLFTEKIISSSLRKPRVIVREITVRHLPIHSFVERLVDAIAKKRNDNLMLMGRVVACCTDYLYSYEIGQQKEVFLETLLCELWCLLLQKA